MVKTLSTDKIHPSASEVRAMLTPKPNGMRKMLRPFVRDKLASLVQAQFGEENTDVSIHHPEDEKDEISLVVRMDDSLIEIADVALPDFFGGYPVRVGGLPDHFYVPDDLMGL